LLYSGKKHFPPNRFRFVATFAALTRLNQAGGGMARLLRRSSQALPPNKKQSHF
jgi:hypothetical protein